MHIPSLHLFATYYHIEIWLLQHIYLVKLYMAMYAKYIHIPKITQNINDPYIYHLFLFHISSNFTRTQMNLMYLLSSLQCWTWH